MAPRLFALRCLAPTAVAAAAMGAQPWEQGGAARQAVPRPTPSPAHRPALPEPVLYDCAAEYALWEVAWTPEWKVWCCRHAGRGCPPTTSSTSTSATNTRSTTTKTPTKTPTKTETATQTATPTSTQSATSTSRSESEVAAAATDADAAGPQPAKCEAVCQFGGAAATCKERIRWARDNYYQLARRPCEAAQYLVFSQCGVCGECTLEAAACTDPADPDAPAAAEEDAYALQFRQQKFEARAAESLGRADALRGYAAVPVAALAAALLAALVRRRHPGDQQVVRAPVWGSRQAYERAPMEEALA